MLSRSLNLVAEFISPQKVCTFSFIVGDIKSVSTRTGSTSPCLSGCSLVRDSGVIPIVREPGQGRATVPAGPALKSDLYPLRKKHAQNTSTTLPGIEDPRHPETKRGPAKGAGAHRSTSTVPGTWMS